MDKLEKSVLTLEGLNCSNCAAKIEDEVNRLEGVRASMNFVMKTLTIETKPQQMKDTVSEATRIILSHEPGVHVVENNKKHIVENNKKQKKSQVVLKPKYLVFGAGAVIYAAAVLFELPQSLELVLYIAAFLILGREVLLRSAKNILRGEVFNENFLMSVATIGAIAIGEYAEGVAVMLFYQIGEFFQDLALERSRNSISKLMDIRPDTANLISDGDVAAVPPERVDVGSLILVKPGERIPLDGVVVEGSSSIDMSALTGETLPNMVSAGNEVFSGSLNREGLITVKVTKTWQQSTAAKILELVENSGAKKASTEKFITRFAKVYTPIVVGLAAAMAVIPPVFILMSERGYLPEWLAGLFGSYGAVSTAKALFSDWIYRALTFLVISCPCALVISVPLGFFGGIGLASKRGILVKGGNYLEALNHIETVVFDKTGTLTKGVFDVVEINPQNNYGRDELLQAAAIAEMNSGHPIAKSIVKASGQQNISVVVDSHREIPGLGVVVKSGDREIVAGNRELMEKEGIAAASPDTPGTIVHVGINGEYAGYIVISDILREDADKTVKSLKNIGINTVMLTGDRKENAISIGSHLGIDDVYYELLPHQKVEMLEKLDQRKDMKKKLVFVGDGMNDAPVLARADIGIAMGGLGSDAAIEAADIVFMTDEPYKLLDAIQIARKTRNVVWQNIVFAFGVKLIVLLFVAGGISTMWEAVFADVGVALIAVMNAARMIHQRKKGPASNQ